MRVLTMRVFAMRVFAMRIATVGVGLALALGGCQAEGGRADDRRAADSAGAPPGDTPVVVELGPDGQAKVRGKELSGDAATCGSMRACCAGGSDVGLFCGLAQATEGATCASVLAETQKYLAERKLSKPAGCP